MDSRIPLLSVALLWAIPSAVVAQTPAPSNTAAPDPTFDSQLLRTLHQANLAEIAAGRMAMARGTSAAVQQYGADVVKDHQSADDQVIALATKLNVTLPAAAPEDEGVKQLTGLKGPLAWRECT